MYSLPLDILSIILEALGRGESGAMRLVLHRKFSGLRPLDIISSRVFYTIFTESWKYKTPLDWLASETSPQDLQEALALGWEPTETTVEAVIHGGNLLVYLPDLKTRNQEDIYRGVMRIKSEKRPRKRNILPKLSCLLDRGISLPSNSVLYGVMGGCDAASMEVLSSATGRVRESDCYYICPERVAGTIGNLWTFPESLVSIMGALDAGHTDLVPPKIAALNAGPSPNPRSHLILDEEREGVKTVWMKVGLVERTFSVVTSPEGEKWVPLVPLQSDLAYSPSTYSGMKASSPVPPCLTDSIVITECGDRYVALVSSGGSFGLATFLSLGFKVRSLGFFYRMTEAEGPVTHIRI